MTIVAHLDLDAFFAAVEELEQSELAAQPLVVGGDPHGRGVVATANYVARTLRHPLCDELRRGAPALPARRLRHAAAPHLRASTRAPSGRRSARSCRPSSERAWTRGTSTSAEVARGLPPGARVVAEAVQAAVRGATSLSCSLGVAGCKVVAKVASDRRKPGGITVVPPGREAAFLAPFPVRLLPGVGPRAEQRLAGRGRRLIGELAALRRRRAGRASFPGRSDASSETAPTASIRGALERARRRTSPSATRRPSRETSPIASSCTSSSAAWRFASPSIWRDSGQVARTVTTKLRYPDFSIRSRSTTLPAGLADGERIGQFACELLDRALADRPGALRLVGVTVSKIEDFEQLALT